MSLPDARRFVNGDGFRTVSADTETDPGMVPVDTETNLRTVPVDTETDPGTVPVDTETIFRAFPASLTEAHILIKAVK